MWIGLELRHIRVLRTMSLRWQRRLIFAGGGLVVGLAAVGLAKAADGAQHAFQQVLRHQPYIAFALTPIGGIIARLTSREATNSHQTLVPLMAAEPIADATSTSILICREECTTR